MTTSGTIDQFEVEHARFNALKTLTTNEPSRFEVMQLGELMVTRDPARPDPYYNRILGLGADSLADLDHSISWIEKATGPQTSIRIDVSTGSGSAPALSAIGFCKVDPLVWLHEDPVREPTPADQATDSARLLTKQDLPALRILRDAEWPIDDAMWETKRDFLCTETFRWYGIFDGDLLVSAASAWINDNIAILGSAFTLPTHRGRGHQRRLVETRRDSTPGQLFVDVAPNSTSYRNCVLAGFIDLERRDVWTRSS